MERRKVAEERWKWFKVCSEHELCVSCCDSATEALAHSAQLRTGEHAAEILDADGRVLRTPNNLTGVIAADGRGTIPRSTPPAWAKILAPVERRVGSSGVAPRLDGPPTASSRGQHPVQQRLAKTPRFSPEELQALEEKIKAYDYYEGSPLPLSGL